MRHLLTSLAQSALLQLSDMGTHVRNTRMATVSITTERDFMFLQRQSPTPRKLNKQTKRKKNNKNFNSKANARVKTNTKMKIK